MVTNVIRKKNGILRSPFPLTLQHGSHQPYVAVHVSI